MDEEKKKIFEKHKEYIEQLAKVNNSSVFIAEYKAKYLFLSDHFQLFGYDPQVMNMPEIDPVYFESRIHPDDIAVLHATQNKLMDFLHSVSVERRKEYKHIYEFRIKKKDGNYARFIFQQQILELDEKGNPWLILGMVDLSPDASLQECVKLSIINYKTGEIVPFSIIEQGNNIRLSVREREVLELASEGLQSKEISDRLFVSIHTINKHRQNIMQKMNTTNILEAINYARKLGLLNG